MKRVVAFFAILISLLLAISTSALNATQLTHRTTRVQIVADKNSYLSLRVDNSQEVTLGEDHKAESLRFTNQGTSTLKSVQIKCVDHCQGVKSIQDIGPLGVGESEVSSIIFLKHAQTGVRKIRVHISAQWTHASAQMYRQVTVKVKPAPSPTPGSADK